MNKILVSSVSVVLTLGVVAPAFAYVPNLDFERTSHRLEVETIKSTRDVRNLNKPSRRSVQKAGLNSSVLQQRKTSLEKSVVTEQTKDTHLDRTRRIRELRNSNRQPKPGSDRYRAIRPNTRSLRLESERSYLPPMIVQTGSSTYDRPTRRDIRENGYFNGVFDRDRDILKEMEENSR
ncbi:hypothetical protein KKF55_06285 [Patescibacteria group bacterium]|nr:hypothetical protein [Patescibacteria group bacterium]